MKNLAASVRARLLAWSKERGIQFQYASMLYMQEGFLSRLAVSPFSDKLILKGGFLIFTYAGSSGRTTKDIDFLGQGIPNDEVTLSNAIAKIVGIEQDDGLIFDTHSIKTERITEGADYHGVRVFVDCGLGTLQNRLQIDIGFGDALSQGPSHLSISGIIGRKVIEVEAYPLATIIAEKFESMIALGAANSRMKDFFDVAFLLRHHALSDSDLKEALSATFSKRRTEMPDHPDIFTPTFSTSDRIQALWKGFLKRTMLGELEFSEVIGIIRKRLEPVYEELRNARKGGFLQMKSIDYKGFRIVFKISKVSQPHPQAGKYMAGEFSIGSYEQGTYTEQQYIAEPRFFDTEAEAEAVTLTRAKRIIEEKYL